MRSVREMVLLLGAAGALCACSNDSGSMMGPMALGGAGAPGIAGNPAPGGIAGMPVSSGTAGSLAAGTGAAAGRGGTAGTTAGAAGSAGAAAGSGGMVVAGNGGVGTAGSAAGGGGMVAAGSGGSAGAAGAAGSMSTRQKSKCSTKGSQVVFLGDSYVNYEITHPLLSTLVADRARADGALAAGQTYRNYAIPGTTLASPNLLGMIAPQWDQAVAEDPDITTVVMTGGGNDVLINNPHCLGAGAQNDPSCQMVVAETLRVGNALITKMREHGVSDGIYFFYPHVPAGGDDINDYSLVMLKMQSASLATDSFHTYVLDLIPVFEGHPEYFASDGIHANAVGEGVIADEIYKIMKDNCIAQPASKGCCMP